MKNKKYQPKYSDNFMKRHFAVMIMSAFLFSGFLMNSCQKDEKIIISMGEPISMSVSETEIVLTQQQADNTVLSINWTRGTNQGSGSSIAYMLEIDQAGSDFSSSQVFEMGTGVFEKSFNGKSLNELVRNNWGIEPGTTVDFEARVFADVTVEDVEDDMTDVVKFSVTSYKPVTEVLYIVGDATPNGWDITNATSMTASASKPWEFSFQGQLSSGSFEFAVSQDDCWCQDFYTRDPNDEGVMVYNEGGRGEDIQWQIEEFGNYKITVDLLELRLSIEQLAGPLFEELYIVGDASPSGWDIETPKAFTRSVADPFIFTYEANFIPGDFKIATFTGDWCDGQWINPSQEDASLTATDFIITSGCDGPDNKWHVTEEVQGRYKITVDTYNNTISIDSVMLYLIGDGGPNGWDIGDPEPMSYDNGVYTFIGELGADNPTGEFKISKFKSDWCAGDWINAASASQPISNTSYITTHGCDGPDNKWKLQEGDAGTYIIAVDLTDELITIVKQ